ncbi:band 7 protein [Solidesulfovibrio carbinoliphilus subsp. oakridgensis]|uniref:Band 7 protein n=1 Tax=Solidesulfovibrio carbinoliphilus subsp. oakridgensis TaxID=694327 RepID=G7Q5B6_9BACT|nr:slipin family protein [Solidesulfovibrio carbinoliphilus]EHJ48439.1 band 7 protein [Solidesulfovibrio carbinoliphilus subsp. oakridgensis]
MFAYIPILAVVIFILVTSLRVLNEYERGVVFRLGRIIGAKGPGLILLFPVIDRMTKLSLRTFAMDVPNQDVITRDNVSIKVNAVVYFRVVDPIRAILEVEDYMYATSQISQTTLRSVCGGVELDEILAHRDMVNERVQTILDLHAGPWGIKVANVELKYIDLPQEMQRAMAKQAEAERERRAKVINAEGEFQAATKLAQAAEIISARPEALQLRYLQTMREMAAESQTATILPIPLDFIRSFFHGPSHAAPARAGMEPAEARPAPAPRTTVELTDRPEATPDGDA